MVKHKKMTNGEIYNTADALSRAFTSVEDMAYPVKVNFFMQKNMNTLLKLAQEIDKSREEIIRKYGEPDPDNKAQIKVSADNIEKATADLTDLFNLEQEVAVNMVELDWFENINMNPQQVAAITFMINDSEEE